ncbi:MAG TPA: MFS transporter [Solirubrobacteraceae bacterium]
MSVEAPESAETKGRDSVEDRRGSRSKWLLVVCCVAQFMVILDLSIVNVALPSIQSSLNFSATDLQWVVDAYAITFAGFLMLGGRAADRFGQRRTMVASLVLFGLASLVGGAALDREMLIGARALQGFAGALMAASSLAIITSSFPAGPERHRAIGLWGAMNGLGGAAGTLLGGVLTEGLSWRWVLLINPPIAIAAAFVAAAVVANRRRARQDSSFDLSGALTLTIGQMVLVYGIVNAGIYGWSSPQALIPIAIGLALLALFGVIEARFAADPLIPFQDLTKPLKVANAIVVLFSAAIFPMWFVSSLYLQQVLGLSPLHAGLAFLPMALVVMVCARSAGKLVTRFGVRLVLGSGLILMTSGLLLFSRIADSGSAIAYVVIPGLLTSAGIGFSIVPSTIAATQGAREGQAGLASGLVNTSRQIGGGLGIALLITLATEYTSSLIGSGHGVPEALTQGFRLAYLIAAGFVAAAAVLTFALVPKAAASAEAPSRQGRISIGVAAVVVGFAGTYFVASSFKGAPIGAYTAAGAQSFVSAPGLYPPKLRTDTPTVSSKLSPGYIFTANFYDLTQHPMVGQSGPLIVDNQLQPVWFKPVPETVVASNLSRQTYQGKPALAWWQGAVTTTGATTSGEDVIANQHYQTVAKLRSVNGWIITLHALVIDGNHAWVSVNKNVPRDLSKYGGTYNGALIDSAVQEYDLSTGKLLFTWDALDHVPLSDSYAIAPTNGFPWDAYHVNSITLLGGGRFLVSLRNTWAAYLVDANTGRIEWSLGGKHSSFKRGPGASFQWQHDVSINSSSLVTLFDDHCCLISGAGTFVPASAPSRGLVLRLDQTTRTATLYAQYGQNGGFSSQYMGNTEQLPSGNVFVGWGSDPYFTEFDRSGQTVLEGVFPAPDLSYRATREQWVGSPLYPPAGAARTQGGRTTVYASWNGATRVVSWRVLAGANAGQLTGLGTAHKAGFETAIAVPHSYKAYEVQALDAAGRVIGTSAAFG